MNNEDSKKPRDLLEELARKHRSSGRASRQAVLHPKMNCEVVRVSPAQAAEWLLRNHQDNRPVSDSRVTTFAADMAAGHWHLTHQGIAFDERGTLIDGQHRLRAVVEAGVEVELLCCWVTGGTLKDPIDRGAVRSVAFLSGLSKHAVGTMGVLRQLESGFQDKRSTTSDECTELWERYVGDYQAITQIVPARRAGPTAAMIWALPIERDVVLNFARGYVSGELLEKGDPALTIRNWAARQPARNRGDADCFAFLNALRAQLVGGRIQTIHATEGGMLAINAVRRRLKIPRTPAAPSAVPPRDA